MANLSDFLPVAGGGSAIPSVATFTSSQAWNVPQSIQDEISNNGYAKINLLMIGGGTTSNSGEIVSDTIHLTSSDYDDSSLWASPSQPQITVLVGASGGNSGITSSAPPTETTTLNFTSGTISLTNIPEYGTNGGPITHSIKFPSPTNINGNTAYGSVSSVTFTKVSDNSAFSLPSGVTHSIASNAVVFSSPIDINDLKITTSASYSNGTGATFYQRIYWSGTQLVQTWGAGNGIQNAASIYYSANSGNIIYTNGNTYNRQSRNGGDVNISEFLNNPQSSEGYFGGYCRFNGKSKGSGGSNPQPGLVKIFYN